MAYTIATYNSIPIDRGELLRASFSRKLNYARHQYVTRQERAQFLGGDGGTLSLVLRLTHNRSALWFNLSQNNDWTPHQFVLADNVEGLYREESLTFNLLPPAFDIEIQAQQNFREIQLTAVSI